MQGASITDNLEEKQVRRTYGGTLVHHYCPHNHLQYHHIEILSLYTGHHWHTSTHDNRHTLKYKYALSSHNVIRQTRKLMIEHVLDTSHYGNYSNSFETVPKCSVSLRCKTNIYRKVLKRKP